MNRDRSWMNWKSYRCRQKPEYINVVNECLDFTFANVAKEGKLDVPVSTVIIFIIKVGKQFCFI